MGSGLMWFRVGTGKLPALVYTIMDRPALPKAWRFLATRIPLHGDAYCGTTADSGVSFQLSSNRDIWRAIHSFWVHKQTNKQGVTWHSRSEWLAAASAVAELELHVWSATGGNEGQREERQNRQPWYSFDNFNRMMKTGTLFQRQSFLLG
jgi:hypothetical protein